MVGYTMRQQGISISVYDPKIDPTAGSYNPRGQLVDSQLVTKVQSYSHELANNWGWKSIMITLGGPPSYLDSWYESGIGRHIEVYDSSGEIITAGFVNRVTVTSNTMRASRGPLIEVCNRCSVVYTPIIYFQNVTPPIMGTEKSTTIAEKDDSQLKYGIIEKVVSGGQLRDETQFTGINEAENLRDKYLEEHQEPDMGDKSFSLGNMNDPAITLEILGYYAWLDLYIYNQSTVGSYTWVSEVMKIVLTADPNGIFSTNYNEIEQNTLLALRYQNDNKTAQSILKEFINQGNDVDDQRRIFGVFEDQKIRYNTIPSTFEYYYKISGKNQNIRQYTTGEDGAIIKPWNVQAGKWMFISDFLPGRFTDTDNKKSDPRAMFIENVNFSAPFGLSVNGIGISELAQYMAKLGVS